MLTGERTAGLYSLWAASSSAPPSCSFANFHAFGSVNSNCCSASGPLKSCSCKSLNPLGRSSAPKEVATQAIAPAIHARRCILNDFRNDVRLAIITRKHVVRRVVVDEALGGWFHLQEHSQ